MRFSRALASQLAALNQARMTIRMKRLVVCVDGTWLDSKDNPEDVPSNVTRIKDAIKPVDAKGIQQKVYYLQGIGTSNSLIDKWVGGATGAGVVDDVCEAYCNLADNYTKGDEIFLFGFSRGAFIVRSLAGLISQQGLRKRDKEKFKDEFLQLQKQVDPQLAENTKTPKAGASGDGVQIKAIGVWDTVGALGIPRLDIGDHVLQFDTDNYRMHDTALSSVVQNAFQALALDEHRAAFTPTLWERPSALKNINLKQCWFPGVHSNVGGHYHNSALADITLAWMMDQTHTMLEFKDDYIDRIYWAGKAVNEAHGHKDWGKGHLYDSMPFAHGFFQAVKDAILPDSLRPTPHRNPSSQNDVRSRSRPRSPLLFSKAEPRHPGTYTRMDSATGLDTSEPLHDTQEFMHASVRIRYGSPDLGDEDEGPYRPPALGGWEACHLGKEKEEGRWVWKQGDDGDAVVLPEDVLGPHEQKLLQLFYVDHDAAAVPVKLKAAGQGCMSVV